MSDPINRQRIITLIALAAVPITAINLFLPSLAQMATDFRVDYNTMNIAISGYLVFTALLQIVAGPLADRYGRRPVLLGGLGLFVAASIGCAIVDEYHWFITLRIIQGSVICAAILSRAIVIDLAERRQAASTLGYIGMAMSLAPILSPIIGGIVGSTFGWRASFWVLTAAGVVVWLMVWRLLSETAHARPTSAAALWRSYRTLIATPAFWSYAMIITLSVGAFFIFISGVPQVASQRLGMSQADIGIAIGSISMGFLIGNYLSGRFAKSVPLDWMILVGGLSACTGLTVGVILLLVGYLSPLSVFSTTVFVGLGNGLTLPSANSSLMSIRKELAASASGLAGAVYTAGGGLFTAVAGFVVTRAPEPIYLIGMMLVVSLASLVLSVLRVRALSP